ncbi:MAG: glycosyltransferase family 39 protein [Cyclobacteriaceae bacterium]
MLKSSILNYQTSLKNSIKSSWVTLWVVLIIFVPSALFIIGFVFESEIAAFIMSLYPPSPQQGFVFYRDLVYIARTEILWLGSFFLLTFILAAYPSHAALDNFLNLRLKKKAVYYMMLVASAFFLTTVLIGSEILEQFPNSADEHAYLFQAEMFSCGKLWERAHDLPDFFFVNTIVQHDGILVSRFPPGWPLVLSAAFDAGLQPSLVNPLLGLLTLVVFYFFTRRYYGELVAIWSLLALATTGFYIFNSASYFSHVSCLLVALLFVFNVYLYQEKNNFVYGLLAGFFLGFVVLIRYYTAVLIFAPFLVYLLMQYRFKAIYLFLLIGLGSLPCLMYFFWYNYSITGNALVPVTVWAYPLEGLGFVKGHTILKGVEHLLRWILMFFYWCSPGLIILYVVFLWRKIKTPAERFLRPEDYAFIALMIGYFFYYQIGGNQYGPRFLFEALPFLVVFVINKVLQARQKWAMALLIASLVYPIVKLPFIVYREERIIDERQNLYDLVDEQKIRNAVVFVSSSTSPIRPMPADDLTRNDAKFLNDVLYAVELPRINDQLMGYYSDRAFYRYVRDPDHPEGELIRMK